MGRLFEEPFKKMAVELCYVKESVFSAAKELDIDADLLSKWRRGPQFSGGTLVPKNNKLSPWGRELRELKRD